VLQHYLHARPPRRRRVTTFAAHEGAREFILAAQESERSSGRQSWTTDRELRLVAPRLPSAELIPNPDLRPPMKNIPPGGLPDAPARAESLPFLSAEQARPVPRLIQGRKRSAFRPFEVSSKEVDGYATTSSTSACPHRRAPYTDLSTSVIGDQRKADLPTVGGDGRGPP